MAVTEEDREQMLDGLLGLRRVRVLLPGNTDVDRGIEGIKTALGEAVSQRTAARALGVGHPEVSKLISAKKLSTVDTSRGKGQVEVESLLLLIESEGGRHAKLEEKAERKAKVAAKLPEGGKRDIAQIMEMRALAFHRAMARNLDRATCEKAQKVVGELRESGAMSDEDADEWEALLDRPVGDVAAKMTDYSPAGVKLRENSPFNSMGRRAED